MCTYKNIDKNKTRLLPLSFHSSCSFIDYRKTAKPMTLRFLDFQFAFTNCFVKLSMSELFSISDWLEVSWKKICF